MTEMFQKARKHHAKFNFIRKIDNLHNSEKQTVD